LLPDISYRKDERTFLPLNITPPNPNKPWTFPDILTSIQNDLQMQRKLAELLKKYSAEQNVCERQGRCALGCIPGARHTFSKKIYDIIKNADKKKQFEIRVLCEVYDIEQLSGVGNTYKYRVYYIDYSAREWKQATLTWNQGSRPFKLDIKLFRTLHTGASQMRPKYIPRTKVEVVVKDHQVEELISKIICGRCSYCSRHKNQKERRRCDLNKSYLMY
jgi:hypothetical protein